MAPSLKHLSFFFLIFLTYSSLIQARESKFFNKFVREKNSTTTTTTTITTPATVNNNSSSNTTTNDNTKETELPNEYVPSGKQEEEPSFTPQTRGSGYGLYGHGSEQYSPTSTTNNAYDNYANLPQKTSTEEYSGGNYEYKEFNTGYNNNNNNNNINNNWSKTKQLGMSDTRFLENGKYSYNVNNENYNNNNNNDNWSKTKQQGMSDTRFVENGKYYYDVNNGNYNHNQYEPMSGNNEESRTSKGVDSTNKYNNYGSNENSYDEFNNSMEENQYQEEENQQEYIP